MRTDARTPDELISSGEIARLFGVNPSAVSNWRTRHPGFPDPWLEIGTLVLYVTEEVEQWQAERAAESVDSKARRIAQLERALERARR